MTPGVILLYVGGGVVAACGLVLAVRALVGGRRRGRSCQGCGYSMEGAPGLICPECGRTAKGERELLKRRRRWAWVILGLVVTLAGLGIAGQGEAMRRTNGWWSLAPDGVLVVGYWLTDSDPGLQELATRALGTTPAMAYAADGAKRQEWARWQRRLIAERTVRVVHGGALLGKPRTPATSANAYMLMAWCLDDDDLATDLARDLLCSARASNVELGFWVAGTVPVTTWPNDPRLLDAFSSKAGDVSSRYRDMSYRALARMRPFRADLLEAATRSCVAKPHAIGRYGGWAEDLRYATYAGGEACVDWLVSLLDDPEAEVRREAADGLGRVAPASEEVLARVRELLEDPDEDVREEARMAAMAIGDALEREGGE